MVASAIIAIVTLMTSMVRAQRRAAFIIACRHSLLVHITLISLSCPTIAVFTSKEHPDNWHSRYRPDKQLVNFISKDDKQFAFDKEILRKERYVDRRYKLISIEVFRDMFSLKNGSTDDHKAIFLDASADQITLLFDILSFPPGHKWSLSRQQIPIAQCAPLLALAETYSFGRVINTAQRAIIMHFTDNPMRVLELASETKDAKLGRQAIRAISINGFKNGCRVGSCNCGIQWAEFDGVSHAWRADLALLFIEASSGPGQSGYDPFFGSRSVRAIACCDMRKVAEDFDPG
jgi:hypothetical protein